MDDQISRQAAIDALIKADYEFTGILSEPRARRFEQTINALPSAQPDNSCDGCRYENADDGVLVPCGFCKRSHPDNYERRTDE